MDTTSLCDGCAFASQEAGKSPTGMAIAAFCLGVVLLVFVLPTVIRWLAGMEPSHRDPFQGGGME